MQQLTLSTEFTVTPDRRMLLVLIDIAINNAPVAGYSKQEWQALRRRIATGEVGRT